MIPLISLMLASLFLSIHGVESHREKTEYHADLRDNLIPQGEEAIPEVAFSTYRLSEFGQKHELHSPVKFEGVNYNNGGHFNLQSGLFTVPQPGLYVFTYSSYNNPGRRVRLMKNHYEVQVLSNDGKGKARNSRDGKNIPLQLEKDDSIWLRLTHGKQNHAKPTNSTLTTFSGYLLVTDFTDDILTAHGRRHKRSVDLTLERKIRALDTRPVALVERHDLTNQVGVATDVKTKPTNQSGSDTTNQKIAFSVTCTKSMIGGHMADTTESLDGEMQPEVSPNGRLAFDKVLVNMGEGFDLEGAEFRAPTDGVYFFTYNVGKFPRKKLSVMLMKNVNEVQSIIYNDSKTRAREIQGQSLMLQLTKSDRVWLRSYNNDEYAVYSNLGNYITFSGYIVYAL